MEEHAQIACPPSVAPEDEPGLADPHGSKRPTTFEKRSPRSTKDDAVNAEKRPGGKARGILDPKTGCRHARFGPKRQGETPAHDHTTAARTVERTQNEAADRTLRDEDRNDGQRYKKKRGECGGHIRGPTGTGVGYRWLRGKPFQALCPTPNPREQRTERRARDPRVL
jgi:hypothetical protein